jgi:FkbM family methyltransferase
MDVIKSGLRHGRTGVLSVLNRFSATRGWVNAIKRMGVQSAVASSPRWVEETLDQSAISRLCRKYYSAPPSSRVRTVVDIGANLGQSAELFSRIFSSAHVYTIEPAQAVFDQLSGRFGGSERVSPLRYAMSSVDGVVQLHHSEHSQCSSLDSPWKGTGSREDVTARRLDTLCEELEIEQIDVLKIDTEGHDLDVLKGASSLLAAGAIDILIVECGFLEGDPCHANFYEIADFVKPFGFSLSGFTETSNFEWIEGTYSLIYCNAIFTRSKQSETIDIRSRAGSYIEVLSGVA